MTTSVSTNKYVVHFVCVQEQARATFVWFAICLLTRATDWAIIVVHLSKQQPARSRSASLATEQRRKDFVSFLMRKKRMKMCQLTCDNCTVSGRNKDIQRRFFCCCSFVRSLSWDSFFFSFVLIWFYHVVVRSVVASTSRCKSISFCKLHFAWKNGKRTIWTTVEYDGIRWNWNRFCSFEFFTLRRIYQSTISFVRVENNCIFIIIVSRSFTRNRINKINALKLCF